MATFALVRIDFHAETGNTAARMGRDSWIREELTMTNFISNATAALIILALAITWLSVFGSVIAGTLGA